MKNVAIIQARTGSSRLPNKVLMKIKGKTILEHVVNRVKQCKEIDAVFVATTILEQDMDIVKLCAEKNIRVFCGSENDVLDRYYQLAKLLKIDNVIRITADCPLQDPDVIDMIIRKHEEIGCDYTSNTIDETFPDGLDCEVIKFVALEEAWQKADLASQREHVTQFLKNTDKYTKYSVRSKTDYGNERWTIDTENDYKFITEIYNHLYDKNECFKSTDIYELLAKKPELGEINSDSVRNEGLIKSLANDFIVK